MITTRLPALNMVISRQTNFTNHRFHVPFVERRGFGTCEESTFYYKNYGYKFDQYRFALFHRDVSFWGISEAETI